MKKIKLLIFLLLCINQLLIFNLLSKNKEINKQTNKYERWIEIQIPTRDGKLLKADLYTANNDTTKQKPVIFVQTPYDKSKYRTLEQPEALTGGTFLFFDTLNYNYVIMDWRGFFSNEESAVAGYDRGLDGYDATEWIAQQKWNNGKIGTFGGSALAQIQFQTIKHHPPHLVCAIPFIKDYKTKYSDFFYGGVFRKEHVESLEKLNLIKTDLILEHPKYDNVWKILEQQNDYPEEINVPCLMISGWFDHYPSDVIRAFHDLRNRSPKEVKDKHKLIIGPWLHGSVGLLKQGILEFPDAVLIPSEAIKKFYDYHILGAKNAWPLEPVIKYFQMGIDTWKTTENWYSLQTKIDTLYLWEHGQLNFYPPPPKMTPLPPIPDTLIYDPKDPAPTVGGSRFNPFKPLLPIGPQDLSNIESRNDILVFSTQVLEKEINVTGNIKIEIFFSSNRKDTDWSVRLCDVYPDGKSIILTQGIKRARFRSSYQYDTLLEVGKVYSITIELEALAHTFKIGHRLRIDISNSNYPMFDINLNNGEELYKLGDTLIAINFLYHSSEYPSRIFLPNQDYNYIPIIEEIQDKSKIKIDPNPFESVFSISWDNNPFIERILISNLLGQIILEEEFLNYPNTPIFINLEKIERGIYFCIIKTKNKKIIKQIIKY